MRTRALGTRLCRELIIYVLNINDVVLFYKPWSSLVPRLRSQTGVAGERGYSYTVLPRSLDILKSQQAYVLLVPVEALLYCKILLVKIVIIIGLFQEHFFTSNLYCMYT